MTNKKWFTLITAGVLSLGLLANGQAAPAEHKQLESQADHSALMKAYAEAEGLYLKAVDAVIRTAGPQHPDAGHILSRLALIVELQGRAGEAEPIYQRAIGILEGSIFTAPADLATALELYGGFLQKQHRDAEAAKFQERARPIRSRLVRELNAKIPPTGGQEPGVRIAKNMEPPKLISKVEPAYSDVARLAKYQGTVVLKIEVGVDGIAHNIELVKGLGYGLDEEAVGAVQKWRFNPGTKDGRPVRVIATIEINFRLM